MVQLLLEWPIIQRRLAEVIAVCGVATMSLCLQGQAGREVLNRDGAKITMEASTASGAMEKLDAALSAWQAQLGSASVFVRPSAKSGPGGSFAAMVYTFGNDRGSYHAFVASDRSPEVCHVRLPSGPQARAALPELLQVCSDELKKQRSSLPAAPAGSASVTAPATHASSSSEQAVAAGPPRQQVNWQGVEGVYFRSSTGIGAGGMVIITFDPVILFKDGSYYEIGSRALEDVDLNQERQSHPRHFGKWTGQGNDFVLTASGGKPSRHRLQEGTFFKAYSAEEGGMLRGTYKSVGGGGNAALGGEMSILHVKEFTFTADGQFSNSSSMGAIQSGELSGTGVTAGSNHRMPAPGTYTLKRHTLTLHFPDGREERHFFAYSSKKSPPQIDREMIFIDGVGYTQ